MVKQSEHLMRSQPKKLSMMFLLLVCLCEGMNVFIQTQNVVAIPNDALHKEK